MSRKIYNPLLHDFSYTWLDDENSSHNLMIPSMDYIEFSDAQADFMERHLIDHIINERGVRLNRYDDRDEIKKEINI